MRTYLLAALATTTLVLTTACSKPAETAAPSTPTISTSAATVNVASGTFSGRSDHITTGTATLVKTSHGYEIKLSGDFELDGAPDPIVAVGNNETYVETHKLGALSNRTGAQTYQLPANITPQQFTQVYIWCEKFSVPLGVATLSAAHGS